MKLHYLLLPLLFVLKTNGQIITIKKATLTIKDTNSYNNRKEGWIEISYEVTNNTKEIFYFMPSPNSDVLASYPVKIIQKQDDNGNCKTKFEVLPTLENGTEFSERHLIAIKPNATMPFQIREQPDMYLCADRTLKTTAQLKYVLNIKDIAKLQKENEEIAQRIKTTKEADPNSDVKNLEYDIFYNNRIIKGLQIFEKFKITPLEIKSNTVTLQVK